MYFQQMQQMPFLIISDINMPVMDGLRLREILARDKALVKKTTPFIFLTTAPSSEIIDLSFEQMVQGFYKKPEGFEALKKQLRTIVDYWKSSLHPNNPFY